VASSIRIGRKVHSQSGQERVTSAMPVSPLSTCRDADCLVGSDVDRLVQAVLYTIALMVVTANNLAASGAFYSKLFGGSCSRFRRSWPGSSHRGADGSIAL
jgi:hypothetical protein